MVRKLIAEKLGEVNRKRENFGVDAEVDAYLMGQRDMLEWMAEQEILDTFEDLLHKQDLLQKKVGTVYDVPYAKDMTLALIIELGEFLRETPFKNWSKKHLAAREEGVKFLDEAAGKEELIDCLHFILNLFNFAGMTADEIWEAYNKKNAVNFERQNTGY